jgi:hypothetical protein
LLANPDRLSRLTDEQRGWVRQAAQDAALRSTDMFDREAESVAAACRQGARFANASQDDLAAVRRAFDPVYASLEQDHETGTFIKEIEALKVSTLAGPPIVIPAGCTGSVPRQATTDNPVAGWWQTGRITKEQWIRAFIAAGGPEVEARAYWADRRYMVITLRFDRSFTEFESFDGNAAEQGASATYKIVNDYTLQLGESSCGSNHYYIRNDTLRLRLVKYCPSHDEPYGITLFATFPFSRTAGFPGTP